MARPKVVLNRAGVRGLLTAPGVRADLEARGDRVRAAAAAAIPVDTGNARDSLTVWSDTTDRAAVRIGSDVNYVPALNAATGFLSRAIDAAGGS